MTRTRYGRSLWLDQAAAPRRPRHPRLRGAIDAEVAIVGGGLTGCSTAHAFAAAGIDTVLLEGDRLGQGGTAASSALIRQELEVDFHAMVRRHGLRMSRDVWRKTRRAAFDLAATLRRLGAKCQLDPQDSIRFAATSDGVDRLRREYAARKKAGLPVSWLTASALLAEANVTGEGAIRVPGNAQLDPYRACLSFAAAATKRGARLFEASRVSRIRFDRHRVELRLEGGTVRAGRVIVATGGPTALSASLARHFKTFQTYAVVTGRVPARVRSQLGRRRAMLWDTADPPHYLRWNRDDRILFGGADQRPPAPRARDRTLVQRTGQLMYELSTLYPAISGIPADHGWEATYVSTPDGLPYIGPHRNYPHHLFALGSGVHGLALAFLASRILLRQHVGEPRHGDNLFGFHR